MKDKMLKFIIYYISLMLWIVAFSLWLIFIFNGFIKGAFYAVFFEVICIGFMIWSNDED